MVHRAASRECALERLGSFECDAGGTLLVVTAHPDDETIGLGATMGALTKAGWDVRVITVTDGAPRNASLRPTLQSLAPAQAAGRRRLELVEALRIGGMDPEKVLQPSFNVTDQDAALHMVEIARALLELLKQRPVDVLLTHPYEGGHPDHDAVAFAAHAAIRLQAEQASAEPTTALGEFTSYHTAGPAIKVATFLDDTREGCERCWGGRLDEDACDRRRAMFDAFASQAHLLQIFDRSREPLRCAPRYHFAEPPHAGPLHYERLPFEWSGSRWRELAQQALRILALTG